jgi:hypothetical protein
MQRILIQLEGRLLWQILAEADPIALQALDELLLILAETMPQAVQVPVTACCSEADWAWLRTQIQSHYPFDLAEELLLRLDVIRCGAAAPQELVYATLTDRVGDESGLLSLADFLELYHAICSLELLYQNLAAPSSRRALRASSSELLQQGLEPAQDIPTEAGFTPPRLTPQQTRILLVSLALLLTLLPHWTTLQEFGLGQAQAEDAALDSADSTPAQLLGQLLAQSAQTSQSAQAWLQIAFSRPASQPESKSPSRSGKGQAVAENLGSEHTESGPAPSALNQTEPVGMFALRPAPVGHLSPLLQSLSQDMLANAILNHSGGDDTDSNEVTHPGFKPQAKPQANQQANQPPLGTELPAVEAPLPSAAPNRADPTVTPERFQPTQIASPQPSPPPTGEKSGRTPPQPATPSSPSQLADSQPTDLTLAQQPRASAPISSDSLLGAAPQTNPLAADDLLLEATVAIRSSQPGKTDARWSQSSSQQRSPNQFAAGATAISAPTGILSKTDLSGETAVLAFQPQLGLVSDQNPAVLNFAASAI